MYRTNTQFQTVNRQQITIGTIGTIGTSEELDRWEKIRDEEIDQNFGYQI